MLRFLFLVILSPRLSSCATFPRLSPEVSNVIRGEVVGGDDDVDDGQEPAELVRWAVPVNEVAGDTAGQQEVDEQHAGQFRTRFCLLASANITIVMVGERNVSVTIPDNSTAKGECEDVVDDVNDEVEKMALHWDKNNSLNMTVTRVGRLAILSEIQAVITTGQGDTSQRLETRLQPEDYVVPSWPLRYGFACSKVITFPLYGQDGWADNTRKRQLPVAIVRIEDLKMECCEMVPCTCYMACRWKVSKLLPTADAVIFASLLAINP